VTALQESEVLHQRVRAFARGESGPTETFDQLALAIARFQERHMEGFRRLVAERAGLLDEVEAIPAVPCDAFRLTRIAVHAPELDQVRFTTSGTTAMPGVHVMRTTETYRELSLRSGAAALLSDGPAHAVVVALAPHPGRPPTSSLGFMLRVFLEAFDGRALTLDPRGAKFDPDEPCRWLASSAGIDVAGLRRAGLLARERQEPLLVLATSLALAALLDTLAGMRVPVPKRTVVMQTGGFKGRNHHVSPAELREATARAFQIPESQIIGEYGMTELTSQLYEGNTPGVYLEPPWVRVTPVDPATLRSVPDGAPGLARITDLGNVDSAVVILTQDLVRRSRGGIELLGRRKSAPPRGCSLGVEALLTTSGAGAA
jgi:hypothetical protein